MTARVSAISARSLRLPFPAIRHQPLALIGGILVGGWILVAVLAPWIAPYDPTAVTRKLLLAPSPQHWLGTDELGRDELSRVMWGARISIPLAMLVVGGLVTIGGGLGAIAGYFGGILETVIMRLADLVFSFPVILLAMAITASLGPGLQNTVIAVLVVAWPSYTRVVRGLVASVFGSDFVQAARLLGASRRHAILKDLTPNIAGPVIVLATLDIGRAVLLLSALSFLGLGAVPPTPEWGSMVATGSQYIIQWWLGAAPGLAIFTLVVGSAFLGDSLRDALDPKSAWSQTGR